MRGLSERGTQCGELLDFLITQGAGFVFQKDRDASANRISQASAARQQLLVLAVKTERAFGDWANQQFKQFDVHVKIIAGAGQRDGSPKRSLSKASQKARSGVNVKGTDKACG